MANPKQTTQKVDPDREAEGSARESTARRTNPRVSGAQFLGGTWYAADGSPLTDAEAQQAHRAMDKAAVDARAKALRGEV